MNKKIVWGLGLFALILVIIAGILYYRAYKSLLVSTTSPIVSISSSSSNPIDNWNTYSNDRYEFSLKYPSGWTYKESSSSYGDNQAFDVAFSSPSNPSDSVDVEVIDADPTATSTAGFFPMIFGADMNTEGVVDGGSITASGTSGEYYENIPGESSYDETLFLHNFAYYGVTNYADDKTYKEMLSTFQFTNAWPCITEPATGLHFCTPFKTGVKLTVDTSTRGPSLIEFDLKVASSGNPEEDYLDEIDIRVFPNPNHLSLNQWFEKNVDYQGVLAQAHSFVPLTLSDGSTALVGLNPLPEAYGGPVGFSNLRLSSSGNEAVDMSQSQVFDFSPYDYSDNQTQVQDLLLRILGTVNF